MCEYHNRPLLDGRCPTCDQFTALLAEKRAKNAGKPIEWRIQLLKQAKGVKKWLVRKCQGSCDLDEATVYYTWSSRPGPDPVDQPRIYSNQKWTCSCGEGNCIHIMRAKEYQKVNRRMR